MRLIYVNPDMDDVRPYFLNPEDNLIAKQRKEKFMQSLNQLRSEGELSVLEVLVLKLKFGFDYSYYPRKANEIADYLNNFNLTEKPLDMMDVTKIYNSARAVLKKYPYLFKEKA